MPVALDEAGSQNVTMIYTVMSGVFFGFFFLGGGGGLNGSLRQYFSLYWVVFQREGEKK